MSILDVLWNISRSLANNFKIANYSINNQLIFHKGIMSQIFYVSLNFTHRCEYIFNK